MSAARLISAGAGFACCALFGLVRCSRITQRIGNTAALAADAGRLAELIGVRRMPLYEAFSRLARESALKSAWQGFADRLAGGAAASEAFSRDMLPELIPGAAETAEEALIQLGSAGAETELERLREAADRLGSLCAKARAEMSGRIKLTRSLSMLAGLGIALLMI